MHCCGRWLGNYTEPKSAVQKGGGLFSRWTFVAAMKILWIQNIKGPHSVFYAPRGSGEELFVFFPFCLNEDKRFSTGKSSKMHSASQWKPKSGQIKHISVATCFSPVGLGEEKKEVIFTIGGHWEKFCFWNMTTYLLRPLCSFREHKPLMKRFHRRKEE